VSAIARIAAVAANEARRLWRERLARTLGGLGLGLVLLALMLGELREQQTLDRQASYAGRADTDWVNQPDRHPHRVVHAGDFVFKAPSPLAGIDWGVESHGGRSVFLEGHRQNTANFSDAALSGGLLRLGDLSPSRVVQQWLPLLMLLAGAAGVAGERQQGTLLAALAHGARGAEWLAGKALALWLFGLGMAAPVLGALLVSAVDAPWLTARALGLGATLVASLGLSALGVVLVSAVARDTLSALLAGTVAWFALAIAAGPMAAGLAALAHPAPTQAEVEQRIAAALAAVGDAHDPHSTHFAEFRARVLDRYGVDRIEDLPVNYGGLVMLEGERLSSAAVASEVDRQRDAWAAQRARADAAAWLLPTLSVHHLAQALAGTDLAHHRHFLDAAERRRFETVQALNTLHAEKIGAANDRDQRLDARYWAGIPRTPISLPPLAVAAPSLRAGVPPVALWALLGLVALWRVGRRLERQPC
jgi:ABC-2 type transport system permease protein